MKYFFCCDNTNNTNNAVPDGQEFLASELLQAQKADLERRFAEVEKVKSSAAFPKWLNVVRYFLFLAALICAGGVLSALIDGLSLRQVYRNAPVIVWIAALTVPASGVLVLCEKLRKKRKARSEDMILAQSHLRSSARGLQVYFSMPDDIRWMEVLSFPYRMKEGQLEITNTAVNQEMMLFCKDDALCVTDGIREYALPLDELTGIRLWEHGIPIAQWHQKGNPKSRQYRNVGVMMQGELLAGLRFCCLLTLRRDGEDYALAFPAYELPTIMALTGFRAPMLPPVAPKRKTQTGKTAHGKKADRIRPEFYWRPPQGTNTGFFFTLGSDIEFRLAHPKLYAFLVWFGIFVLFLPTFIYFVVAASMVPDRIGWMLLGFVGSFGVGIGLFNLVAAWIRQYLGHIVTIVSIGAGTLIMIVSLLLL